LGPEGSGRLRKELRTVSDASLHEDLHRSALEAPPRVDRPPVERRQPGNRLGARGDQEAGPPVA
jgi:hypothetical protein